MFCYVESRRRFQFVSKAMKPHTSKRPKACSLGPKQQKSHSKSLRARECETVRDNREAHEPLPWPGPLFVSGLGRGTREFSSE